MKLYSIKKGGNPQIKSWQKLLIISVIVIIGATLMLRQIYVRNLRPVSDLKRTVFVTIPDGASAQEISQQLSQKGLIRASWAFDWYVRSHNALSKLQAGTYSLRPTQSVPEIVQALTHGKVFTDLVRISPGLRLEQIRSDLISSGFEAEKVDAALKPELYAGHPALADKPASANLEGYLYPESFQRTANTKPETIIKQSLDEMNKHLTADIKAAFAKQGLKVHEGVILASIVEQEVNNLADKPIVAQVFLRRFHQSMQLGSDVTAFYGAIINDQPTSVSYDSPYNTRLHSGLPPGPISNVSAASLKAVAFPADSDYLYFVAGDGEDQGKTYFSHTLAEHEALTAQHCKTLCQ